MEINNLYDITEKNYILKKDDIVNFFISPSRELKKYTVRSKYLNNDVWGFDNSEIFDIIGFGPTRHKFCSFIYGYKATQGDWPEAQSQDYESLTRLVKVIYILLEVKEKNIGLGVEV